MCLIKKMEKPLEPKIDLSKVAFEDLMAELKWRIKSETMLEIVRKGLQETAQQLCSHKNIQVHREGLTGTLGTIICMDCGYSRE